jgi:D-allose transport system substrate-binding protein
VIGVDGIKDARDAVLDGRMAATVAQLPYFIGKRAVEMAVQSASGHAPHSDEITPTPVLTTDMLKANTDPVLKYVR